MNSHSICPPRPTWAVPALLLVASLAAFPAFSRAACAPGPQRQLEALEAQCKSEQSPPLARACSLALDRMRRCLPPGLPLESGESQLDRYAIFDPGTPSLRYLVEFDPPTAKTGEPVTVHSLTTWTDSSRSVRPAERHRMRRLLARHCRRERDARLRPVCRAFNRTLTRWPRWTSVSIRSDEIEVQIPQPAPGHSPGAADRRCAVTFVPAARPEYVGDLYCCLECL